MRSARQIQRCRKASKAFGLTVAACFLVAVGWCIWREVQHAPTEFEVEGWIASLPKQASIGEVVRVLESRRVSYRLVAPWDPVLDAAGPAAPGDSGVHGTIHGAYHDWIYSEADIDLAIRFDKDDRVRSVRAWAIRRE